MKELGSLLRKVREERKLSMKNVCEKTGITNSRLSRIENGINKSTPPVDDLISLAKLYDLDFNELLLLSKRDSSQVLRNHKIRLKNIELLSEKELQHVQDEINFIISQKGNC